MEEIDKIIINTLKNINCPIDEEITALKQFDADLTVAAISSCLEAINPEIKSIKNLPPSMSLRLKTASHLAQQIKNLGFKGDMGYQTILYCNEIEIRRVLMFLVENLPREFNKTIPVEELGYVPRLIREIENKVKLYREKPWVPTNILNKGIRSTSDGVIIQSFGNSCPLKTINLEIPDHTNKDEVLNQYWNSIVPDCTKQCKSNELIPSLLFKSKVIETKQLRSLLKPQPLPRIKSFSLAQYNQEIKEETLESSSSQSTEVIEEENATKLSTIIKEIENEKNKLIELQNSIKCRQAELNQINKLKKEEEEAFKSTLSKVKIKNKTLTVISKEENKLKLKSLVENGNERLVDLANQWNEVRTPLLEQYKSLQNNISSEETLHQQVQNKIKQLKETYKLLLMDLNEKEQLEQKLNVQIEQINKNNNRSNYTRRILEIISNIKKQDDEINKVLNDTKVIQKDINILTGQVDRSFTLADELIFRDKYDETARKAYKLLAQLRKECGDIIKIVSDLGLIERESRNLQEQVDMERAKQTSGKLERVLKDLAEIQKEIDLISQKQTL